MKPSTRSVVVSIIVTLAMSIAAGGRAAEPVADVAARLVAVGIPGIGAVSAGRARFHPGGPDPGQAGVPRPTRSRAACSIPSGSSSPSSSNFGAPLGHGRAADRRRSSRIDPRAAPCSRCRPTSPPPAARPSARMGRVLLFTANSPAFVNRVYNPGAVDRRPTDRSRSPTAISHQQRLRPALVRQRAVRRRRAPASETVIDPDGRPLAGAPSKVAGGVFAGDAHQPRAPAGTRRDCRPARSATALLGKSPDGSGRAVFAGADRRRQRGPGARRAGRRRPRAGRDDRRARGRLRAPPAAAMVFNWVPNRILYIADPALQRDRRR